MPEEEITYFILPEQLQIGLFIHLDLGWMDHPFVTSSFKIKSQDQIDSLIKLGLKKIRYSPDKSDIQLAAPDNDPAQPAAAVLPDPPLATAPATAPSHLPEVSPDVARYREQMLQCEKSFNAAAQMMRNLERQLANSPKETVVGATRLVDQMLNTLLANNDIAIHLMSEKAGGDSFYFHSLNVTVLSLMLAREMKCSREQIQTLGLAGLMHDIGKTRVPSQIRLKADPLNHAEQKTFEQHCLWGVEMGLSAGLPQNILRVIAQHHEHCDGSGYPKRLKLDEIDPLARILALANNYDNLCNRLNPVDSLTPHEALAQMFSQQKNRFDPLPLSHLIKSLGVYPPGTAILLSDNSYAIVVSVNVSHPLRPFVLACKGKPSEQEARLVNLELEREINISKSLKPSQLPRQVQMLLRPCKHMTYFFSPCESP